MSTPWRTRSDDHWFRIGRLEVTSVLAVVLASAFFMIASAFAPALVSAMAFSTDLVLNGQLWRIFTWPLAQSISLWGVLTVAMFWYFGGELERQIGHRQMAKLLVGIWFSLTVSAFVIGLVFPVGGLAGLGLIEFLILLLWIAEYPNRSFFFGIPAWIVGLILVAVQVLELIAARAWASLVVLVVGSLLVAVIAKRQGLLTDYQWLPGGRPRPRAPKVPTVSKSEARASARAQADRARLDDLLDKINDGGLHSLSDAERAELLALRGRLRGDR